MMKTCRDHQKTLWMDVFNELSPSERREWEHHLNGCESCQAEKLQGLKIMGMARRSGPRQVLSEAAVQRIARLGLQVKKKQPHPRFSLFPFRQLAAGAAAFFLVAVLMWWNAGPDIVVRQPPVLSAEEVEVIENLDLLREMDALQKLVKRVDRKETDDGNLNSHQDRRTKRDEEGYYV